MFQYLFFCCSANSKDPAHTVSLEDINNKNPLITKNSENMKMKRKIKMIKMRMMLI